VIEGFTVKYMKPIGYASSIIASYGSKIVLYDSTHTALIFSDMITGNILSVGLDSAPISSSLYNSILGVLTSTGTVYIFNVSSRSLLSTYSIPGSVRVEVSRDYVFVQTPSSIHAISIKSLKDVFVYKTAGIPVSSRYLFVTPDNTMMFSTSDSTLIIRGMSSSEPFSFEKYIPYKVNLEVRDPWGHIVPGAKIFVDGVYAGQTSDAGTISFSLNKGTHTLLIDPPKSYTNVTQTQLSLNVTSDLSETVVLKRIIYQLNIALRDPRSPSLAEPVNVIVEGEGKTLFHGEVYRSTRISLWVAPGTYRITVNDTQSLPYYEDKSIVAAVEKDTNVNLTLDYKLYPVKFKVIDSASGAVVNGTFVVCTPFGCTSNSTVYLPKGKHTVSVEPIVYYNGVNLFKKTPVQIAVPEEKVVVVKAERSYYIVNLLFVDSVSKKLVETPLTVTVGGVSYKNVRNITLMLPGGNTLVKVGETPVYVGITKQVTVNSDGNISVAVPRKTRSVLIKVSSIIGSVKNGVIFVKSALGVYKVIPVPPSGEITLDLPIDWYTVKFESNLYSSETIAFNSAQEDSVILLTKPTIKGIFILYSNIIFAGIGVVLALVILYWMSKKTVEKVRSIKEISELLGEEYGEGEESETEAEEEK
ncbi:MAG: hypothetical protein F7B59_00300, partial [Desulfurococcales archaeon]|nr:hypothetical protein [Desulfurococcales archaeon]